MASKQRGARAPRAKKLVKAAPAPKPELDALNSLLPAVAAPALAAGQPANTQAKTRTLRRTQSATLPACSSRADVSYTGSLSGIDSDSDSEFPDAFSIMLPDSSAQKPSTKRKSLNPPDSNGVKRRKKQRRVLSLPKSASEIPHSAGNDDVDSGAELDSLKVPGELVMALYLRKYYPARVLSRPAHNRFEIEFFDGKKATMSRGRFYTVYEPKFCTCPMGAIQLIGDEPARGLVGGAEAGASQDINPERDFERDCKLCPWLIVSMEKLRHHLDALHNCTADMLDEMAKVEDRMAAFFGHDASAKRMLPLRISPGFLNRAEFDFLGRLLCRWYTDPPSAIRQAPPQCDHELTATASSDDAPPTTQASDPACSQSKPKPADEDFREGSESSHSTEPIDRSATPKPATSNEAQDKMDMTDLGASAMAIKFIHEVLLPHAIKRMIVEREDCSLEAAEERMCRGDTEVRWVDQILAARGNMQS